MTKDETLKEIAAEPHPYMVLLFLFTFFGLKAGAIKGKVTTFKIDERWTCKINGHSETLDNIPPFCFSIDYNGWPAGILAPTGDGVLCAGEGANEDTLRHAVISRIENTLG